ncbi:N-acetylmuramoyl-L-alanine amidase [Neisseria sp.]|uniref:N-acetylmuramoyl-L-alanine amidase n=1 Tax=Neisseria sp. TaxID=192066 RepID=UPI0035A0BD42
MVKTELTRRQLVRNAAGIVLTVSPISAAIARTAGAAEFAAVRIWPAQAYTRITLEATRPMRHRHFSLDNPNRLVVDIENANVNSVLQTISGKVQSNDPYIRSIRAGQNTPTTVRVVVDLKQNTHPQVFTLAPVAGFKNRLVIDLYPAAKVAGHEDDPMMALLNDYSKGQSQSRPPQTGSGRRSEPPVAVDGPVGGTGPSRPGRRPIVMLDPGHGGEDPGAIARSGLREKDVVLSIARETKKRLEAMGCTVYMTRNEDVFIPLNVRVAKGRARKADVFVSIHADSFTSPTARGTGVYALNTRGATSAAARFLAQTQNNADAIGGVSRSGNRQVDNTILDMTQTATIRDSMKLGSFVLTELGKLNKLHKGRVDQANFAVLKAPDIPSILVETAFLSNPTEAALLASTTFRQQSAQAIANGVQKYLRNAVLRR